jgi:hypothetical protein
MKNWRVCAALSAAILVGGLVAGCTSSSVPTEHYVSPKIEGAAQKINLEAVEKAFWETKGKDFNEWMGAFEKRVNEIYEGNEVVSIDATRQSGKLVVTGYIDKDNKEGFHPGDDKLFSLEQTGDAVNNEVPYRVSGNDGRAYYEGHHSLLDNPFLQAWLISNMVHGWTGSYYTRSPQVIVLHHDRDAYRTSPGYAQTQNSNRGFFSRFKTKSNGDLTSSNKFGGASSSNPSGATPRRSLFGFGRSSGTSGSDAGSSSASSSSSSGTSLWGGRRSSSGSSFGSFRSSSRGWGGRRR